MLDPLYTISRDVYYQFYTWKSPMLLHPSTQGFLPQQHSWPNTVTVDHVTERYIPSNSWWQYAWGSWSATSHTINSMIVNDSDVSNSQRLYAVHVLQSSVLTYVTGIRVGIHIHVRIDTYIDRKVVCVYQHLQSWFWWYACFVILSKLAFKFLIYVEQMRVLPSAGYLPHTY